MPLDHPPGILHAVPPMAWPLGVLAVVAAMQPGDWVTVIVGVIGATGGSAAIFGRWAWGKWESSNARLLAVARRELAECKADNDQLDADLRDERSDRAAAKERNRVEAERRGAENDELRELVSSLRAQLAEAYKTIADRDHTVTDNSRRIDRANATLTVLSAMVLELLGDARSRKP